MIADSFRLRLSLWNVAVLAAVLTVMAGLLVYGMQTGMQAAVDRDLTLRARRFEQGPPEPRPPRPPAPFQRFRPFQPFPSSQQPEPPSEGRQERLPPPDQAPPPPERYSPGPPGPERPGGFPAPVPERRTADADPDIERAISYTRPRFITWQGEIPGWPPHQQPWDAGSVAASLNGEWRFSTVLLAGERVRVLSAPWRRGPQIVGAVQLARPMGEYDRLRDGQLRAFLMLCPLALIAAGAGGLFLTERALRPVREVTRAAAQINAEDLSRRLTLKGRDELAQLAATFNAMIDRIQAAFEQQRRFTADASHELRTPLARIKVTTSEALSGEQSEEEYRAALRIADQAADGMSRLVEELLLLARVDGGQLPLRQEGVDVREVIDEVIGALPALGPVHPSARLPQEPLRVDLDPHHLERVLANLLENALRHTPEGGTVTVDAVREGDEVRLRVIDTGEGIAPEHLPHVCERFYRVDPSRVRSRLSPAPPGGRGGGCGLGLAISQSLVQANGGRMEISSLRDQGTTVTLSFPASSAQDRLASL